MANKTKTKQIKLLKVCRNKKNVEKHCNKRLQQMLFALN